MADPRLTVDQIGIEHSRRYAEDRKKLEQNPIAGERETWGAEIPSITPYTSLEVDPLFEKKPPLVSFAHFSPPDHPSFASCFSHELIPSIGSSDDLQEILDRLAEIPSSVEKEKVGSCLQELHALSRAFDQISSRRNEYQKG